MDALVTHIQSLLHFSWPQFLISHALQHTVVFFSVILVKSPHFDLLLLASLVKHSWLFLKIFTARIEFLMLRSHHVGKVSFEQTFPCSEQPAVSHVTSDLLLLHFG